MHIEINPWKTELDEHAKRLKAEIESLRPSPIIKETRVEIRDAPRDPELPAQGRPGQILMLDQDGTPVWVDLPKAETYDDSPVKKLIQEHKDIVDIIAEIVQERAVTNYEKEQLIKQLGDYWLETHEDCFTETADGRKIFRPELLTYKHDIVLRQISAKKLPEAPQAPISIPPAPVQNKRVWVAICVLALIQLIYMVLK